MPQRSKTKDQGKATFKRRGPVPGRARRRTPQGGTTFDPGFENEGPVSQKNTKKSDFPAPETRENPADPSTAPARPPQVPEKDYVHQASGKNSKNFTNLPPEVLRLLPKAMRDALKHDPEAHPMEDADGRSSTRIDWTTGLEVDATQSMTDEEMLLLQRAALDEIAEKYKFRPVEFVEDLLLHDFNEERKKNGEEPFVIQKWQKEVLVDIANGVRRISIRAGHGVGKSAVCSWAAVHQMVCYRVQKCIMTAPTAGQLFDALFPEVRFWMKKLPPTVLQFFELYSDHIDSRLDPDGSFMSARTSSSEKPEAMQGIHSPGRVLLICDEASGIDEAVYEAAAGSMSGHNACTLLISNPTRNQGLFHKSHHSLKNNGSYRCYHVSCIGNPLASHDFIQQIIDTYGEGSNAYRVRVLGEFPAKDDDTLIASDLVDAAMIRDVVLNPQEPLRYGVDVARFGDDRTVLCKRRGNIVIEFIAWEGMDTVESTGIVHSHAQIDKPDMILVDAIGVGAGVADNLRALGYNVRDVNVSETAALNPQAHMLRDELWIAVRDWLNTRAVKLPRDERLKEELVAPTYDFTKGKAKLIVESKRDVKKRLKRSPDFADALCMTFAGDTARIIGRGSGWVPGKPLRRNIKGATYVRR
jgi:phage terminase large subunit